MSVNLGKIRGKSLKFIGENGGYFTNGEHYRIGRGSGKFFTVDDEGDDHELSDDFLINNFDVSEYIEKPSLVGKYVRYTYGGSSFMRKGDIGIVVEDDYGGSNMKVRWLNPWLPHTHECPVWTCSLISAEVVE